MKIFINFAAENRYGGFLQPPLRYFHLYLSDLMSDIKSPVKSLDITFAYASKNPQQNSERFLEWYDSLPNTRFAKKSGIFSATIRFSQLCEYQENVENYSIFPPLFEKLREVINLVDAKMRKNGISLKEPMELILRKAEREINKENLERINKLYEFKSRKDSIDKSLADREQRKNVQEKPNKLIYDIRFYCRIKGMSNLDFSPHQIDICGKILQSLRAEKFKLPNFTHLYICVSDSFENALYHTIRSENWFAYGIAILKNPSQTGLIIFFKPTLIVIFIYFAMFMHSLIYDVFMTLTMEQFGLLKNLNTELLLGLNVSIFQVMLEITASLGAVYIMWKLILTGPAWTVNLLGLKSADNIMSNLESKLETRSFNM